MVLVCFSFNLLFQCPGFSEVSKDQLISFLDPPVSAYARSFENDLNKVFRFVSDEIDYQPYAGVLRGARGALWSGAGNSYDQAVLLANLLKEMKIPYRYAFGSLDADQVNRLLQSLKAPEAMPTMDIGYDALSPQERQEMDAEYDQSMQLFEIIQDRTEKNFHWLTGLLEKSGIHPPEDPADPLVPIRKQMKDHVWIQVQQEEAWVDLDPSFQGAEAGEVFGTLDHTAEKIPEEKWHRITTSVKVQQGGKGKVKTVLEGTERVADFVGKSISVINLKHTFFEQEILGSGLAKMIAGQERLRFKPTFFIGDDAYARDTFAFVSASKEKGLAQAMERVSSSDEGSSKQGMGGLFGGLDGALGTKKSTAPKVVKTTELVEWIEMTVHSPDGRKQEFKWDFFDSVRFPHANPLMPVTQITILPGRVPYNYLTALAVHHADGTLSGQLASMAYFNYRHAVLRDELLNAIYEPTGSIRYVNRPNILVTEYGLPDPKSQGSSEMFGMNLAQVPVQLLPSADASPQALFNERIFLGLLDIEIERALVEDASQEFYESTDEIHYTGLPVIFEAVRENQIPIRVLTRADADQVNAFAVSEELKNRIRWDLYGGYAVVVPERPVVIRGQDRFGWWKIHLKTGETIDELDSGKHVAFTSEVVVHSKDPKQAEGAEKLKQQLCRIIKKTSKRASQAFINALKRGWEASKKGARIAVISLAAFGGTEAPEILKTINTLLGGFGTCTQQRDDQKPFREEGGGIFAGSSGGGPKGKSPSRPLDNTPRP